MIKRRKREQIILCVSAIVIAMFAVVPFNKFSGKLMGNKNFEIFVKLVILPVPILVMCLNQYNKGFFEIRRDYKINLSTLKMTYMPAVIYQTGCMLWMAGLIYSSATSQLTSTPYFTILKENFPMQLAILFFVVSVVLLNVLFVFSTAWLAHLSTKALNWINKIFVASNVLLLVTALIVYFKIDKYVPASNQAALYHLLLCACVVLVDLAVLIKAIYEEDVVILKVTDNDTLNQGIEKHKAYDEATLDVKEEFEKYASLHQHSYITKKEMAGRDER